MFLIFSEKYPNLLAGDVFDVLSLYWNKLSSVWMISNCQKNVALKYIFFKKKDAFKDELATLKSVKFITHIDP